MIDALLRHPARVLLAIAAVTAAFAAGIPRLTTDVGYRAFLGPQHPAIRSFDAFLSRYGGGLPLRAVWSCADTPVCENALDAPSLAMVAGVAAALAASPAVTRVVHPGNAPLLMPTRDGPVVRRLLAGSDADAEALRAAARADPSWSGEIVSADGTVGCIVVELRSSASEVASRAYADLDAALAPFEARGFVFQRVGGPVEFVVAGAELDAAMARIVPIMVLLVAIGLLVLLRSVAAAAMALATVGIAVVWTHGALGWIGWPRNSLTQTLPPLVLVIGVCDGIHLISRYRAHCAARPAADVAARRAALSRTLSEVARPCVMTTLTTAAGFASFATAELDSFVHFGLIAAFGVLAALALTFTLLPALLVGVPIRRVAPPAGAGSWTRRIVGLSAASARRARWVLAIAALLLVTGVAGFARLRVDSSFEDLYGADSAVVRWARFTADQLAPSDRLEIDLRLPEGVGVGSPEVRRAVESLRRRLGGDGLAAPRSFLSRPRWREELLAAGSGDLPGLTPWVDLKDRHVRVSFPAEKLPQDEMRAVMRRTRTALARLPEGYSGVATGPFALVSDMVDAIQRTQLESFGAAALAIALLLWIYLGSLRLALLAMLPTALPVIATLGLMGLLGIALDIGSAMVGAVVLGIGVDDTIHVLDRYQRLRARGAPAPAAIVRAIDEVGEAVVATSLALSLGFAALALSPWQSVASFGVVASAAILAALATTLLVLPALVCVADASGSAGHGATRYPPPRHHLGATRHPPPRRTSGPGAPPALP